jgi:uncharacterized protein (DUF2062 family)
VFRRLWEKILRIWQLAKSERAAPGEIGWAVALGAFIGCTPAVGLRPWIAVGVATLVKKNRLFAYLGSHTSNIIFTPFITLAEIQLAHRVRTGTWLDIDRKQIVDEAPALLLDWCLGAGPVGLVVALVLGFAAYGIAHRRDVRKQRALAAVMAEAGATPPSPAELPPPSSGSPA